MITKLMEPLLHREKWIGAALALLALLSASVARSVEYDFTPPPVEVFADLEQEFTVYSHSEIRLEPAPEHPRIAWLPADLNIGEDPIPGVIPSPFYLSTNGKPDLSSGEFLATFRFIPLGKGAITPPPIPITIGGQRILLRLPKMSVSPNGHAGLTEMITLWNGKVRQPESLRIGETVDLEILSISPFDAPLQWRAIPALEMDPVRWYRATVPNLSTAIDLRFHRFGRRIFERDRTTYRDRECWVVRYKTRFTVLPGDRLKGVVGLTLLDGSYERTHYESIDVPVAPLPPQPSGSYIKTGLLGDCQFEANLDPPRPTSDQPFTITLRIEATGDSKLLRDLDFSRPGFRSIESSQSVLPNTNFDKYRGRFRQTLIADGTASTFPAIKLLNFDTPGDAWKIHQVTETLHFADLGDSVAEMGPAATLGLGIQRPILLNLHPAAFGVLAAAPFLPIIASLLARQRRKRDPQRSERARKLAALRKKLKGADDGAAPKLLDDEGIPLLRAYCELPDGASTRDLAGALEQEHGELSMLLREHSDAAFGSNTKSPVKAQKLSQLLARISFAILLFCSIMPGGLQAEEIQESLDAAVVNFVEGSYESAADRYEKLLIEYPDHVALHLNLARARLAADQLHGARASAHTAVLLDPLDKEARELLNAIHRRLGDPPLPGSAVLALRPDQLLSFAVAGWGLAFFCVALRRLRESFPRWPAAAFFLFAVVLLACALWRNSHAYAADQYMVVTEELPREPKPGRPSYEFPPLRSGAIVRASVSEEVPSHLRVETADTSFWLPAEQLQKIW
ncbi:MAG: hypothetical protein ACI9UA_002420 [Pseudoalteromonas tetraodonis]|jgi:tetratricopeptide (TPR) repeat protein